MSYNEFPKLRPHPSKDDAWVDAKVDAEVELRADAEQHEPATHTHADCPPLAAQPAYTELAITSNYTFLCGASHPEELVQRAHALGHTHAAIADVNSLAGVVRAHVAAKTLGIACLIGSRLRLQHHAAHTHTTQMMRASTTFDFLAYPTSREAYARLSRLLTVGKRRAPKGECWLSVHDLAEHASGLMLIALPPRVVHEEYLQLLAGLKQRVQQGCLWVGVCPSYEQHASDRMVQMRDLAKHAGLGLVAHNDVLYHDASRREVHDVLTCIRAGCTLREAGTRLQPNAQRHLRTPSDMLALLAPLQDDAQAAMQATQTIAVAASGFALDQLQYDYPAECTEHQTPTQLLRELVERGCITRYDDALPPKVREQVQYELAMIAELGYEAYFLTCEEIVSFARGRGILCQGRGGAANSAVCFVLGITEVDPAKFSLLFERFISRERREPPDIDIDFEHERREEVIQHIYQRYGREHAALTAEVISYRGRSAVREVGKVMGLSGDAVSALAKSVDWWGDDLALKTLRAQGRKEMFASGEQGLTARVLHIARQLIGFPRHLSQHVGGFVITKSPLCELVPVENAAMEDRTVIEWDKDDIDAMGMLKIDVLGLGMLTCVRKAMEYVRVQGCRDGETQRCSERQSEDSTIQPKEHIHARSQHIPRSDCVAEKQTTRCACTQSDESHAAQRTFWSHKPNAQIKRLSILKHCGGICEENNEGVSPKSAYCERLACRICNSVGYHYRAAIPRTQCRHCHHDNRDRQNTLCNHQSARSEATPKPIAHTSSSLHPSIPPSLHLSPPSRLSDIPWNDIPTYNMICAADTVGVFQIESRAQMSMLPRLRPRTFYDLVIEVAIVRPGPIQGGMVHPYLKRRSGEEPVTYPSEAVRSVLERTLGVPIFQEQAMRLAIVAAGFTPDQADGLRRAMASWKRKGDLIYRYGQKLMDGMLANGYPREFAERCFEQIKGFSEYGFPESHAASFALLVYASAWLKCHHPAAFAAALINSQPMGFYAPAQIVRDAKEHGVVVHEIDVLHSDWDCTVGRELPRCLGVKVPSAEANARADDATSSSSLDTLKPEHLDTSLPSLRLGMRLIRGLQQVEALAVARVARERRTNLLALPPARMMLALWRESNARVRTLRLLASADAFASFGLSRQQALWHVRSLKDESLPLFDSVLQTTNSNTSARVPARTHDACPQDPVPQDAVPQDAGLQDAVAHEADSPPLPAISPALQVLQDYRATGLSMKAHPMQFARSVVRARGAVPMRVLRNATRLPDAARVCVAGLVLVRQRPSTASGVLFITLEDETGIANLVVWPKVFEKYKADARISAALFVQGRIQRQHDIVHVIVSKLQCIDDLLHGMRAGSRDFR